jgi:hypothetical protein
VTVFCLACLYLAVDHVDDLLLGVALGVAIPVSAFRFFTPNEVFPVAYRRGNTAHVDVTGPRGEAIRQGMRDQLGLTVTGITPVGLESSAGSIPLPAPNWMSWWSFRDLGLQLSRADSRLSPRG